ncbi:MAG: hypothetical protein ACM3O4_00100 [Ignavibacteriales bacterium]
MRPKIIILLGLIILITVFFIINPFKKDKEKSGELTVINNLTELFPSKATTLKFEQSNSQYQLKITDVKKENDTTTIISKYDITNDNQTTTVETTYVIMPEKIVESGKFISDGKVVSIIYPIELLVGMPYEKMSWKTPDKLVTNTVTSMKNNQVTIESVRTIDIYEVGKNTSVKKEYKETRIFEKGKGIVLFRSEIVGDKSTIVERKLIR